MRDTSPPEIRRLPVAEFTALLAMLFATVAVSIDAMLPALPAIAAEMTPQAVNRAQLVLTAFVFGMGIGTLFAGPVSDSIGRKRTIAAGFAVYMVGAGLAYLSQSLEMLLLARFLQGLGAAGPRVAGVALVRDLYQGREMARIMSFVMMVFMVVPALAPLMGVFIIGSFGWRGIFLVFILFGAVAATWFLSRQAETLTPDHRRPLSVRNLWSGAVEVLTGREVMLYTVVMALGFGQMFALLSSIQQIFADTYGRNAGFPYWFAGIAVVSATASMINSYFVVKLGMRRIATLAYLCQLLLSLAGLAILAPELVSGGAAFAVFYIWATSVFFIAGLTFGNLNALAMQKLGHIAGLATSVISAVSTVGAVAIAAPVGLAFDGTPHAAMAGAALCSALAFGLMRWSEKF